MICLGHLNVSSFSRENCTAGESLSRHGSSHGYGAAADHLATAKPDDQRNPQLSQRSVPALRRRGERAADSETLAVGPWSTTAALRDRPKCPSNRRREHATDWDNAGYPGDRNR